MKLEEKLVSLRKAKGLSQMKLAEKSHIQVGNRCGYSVF